MTTFVVVPLTAPMFGRERIAHRHNVHPTNYLTVLFNRNYVRPELNKVLANTSKQLAASNIQINYLDANFPFINKFPLLPHLSHHDGKKIDLSLVYQTPDGSISTRQKSLSGYGVFVAPQAHEVNQPKICMSQGRWLYDYPRYLSFGHINKDLTFSAQGTQRLLEALLQSPKVQKVFIEPHLKQRLGLNDSRIRYHGCHAVRHDDHIHLQIN